MKSFIRRTNIFNPEDEMIIDCVSKGKPKKSKVGDNKSLENII